MKGVLNCPVCGKELSMVTEEEMQEIENLYGEPMKEKEVAYRKGLEIGKGGFKMN